MWIHINKFGVNLLMDSDQVHSIYFAMFEDVKSCVVVKRKDGTQLEITSDELTKNKGKCHELLRELALTLNAKVIANQVA